MLRRAHRAPVHACARRRRPDTMLWLWPSRTAHSFQTPPNPCEHRDLGAPESLGGAAAQLPGPLQEKPRPSSWLTPCHPFWLCSERRSLLHSPACPSRGAQLDGHLLLLGRRRRADAVAWRWMCASGPACRRGASGRRWLDVPVGSGAAPGGGVPPAIDCANRSRGWAQRGTLVRGEPKCHGHEGLWRHWVVERAPACPRGRGQRNG
jgi:hypothetical protein